VQVLDATGTSVGDAFMASLPPSLAELRIADCANVTPAADVCRLTALRRLETSVTTDLSSSDLVTLRARGCVVTVKPAPVAATLTADSMAVVLECVASRDWARLQQQIISMLPVLAGADATV